MLEPPTPPGPETHAEAPPAHLVPGSLTLKAKDQPTTTHSAHDQRSGEVSKVSQLQTQLGSTLAYLSVADEIWPPPSPTRVRPARAAPTHSGGRVLVEVLVTQEQAVHVARGAARAVPVPAPVSDAAWPQVTAEEAETRASPARPGGRAAHGPCVRPPHPQSAANSHPPDDA